MKKLIATFYITEIVQPVNGGTELLKRIEILKDIETSSIYVRSTTVSTVGEHFDIIPGNLFESKWEINIADLISSSM